MKILVLGDYISDVYTFGKATRLCPEAPVPVIVPQKEETRAGGAGLVYEQLHRLGLNADYFFFSRSTKKRLFADGRLLFRIDIDAHDVTRPSSVNGWFENVDAIVISDYGKGAMTRELARQIVETGMPCFVDAKHHWHWYSGSNVTIFPNEHECLDETFMADQVVRKLGKNGADHHNLHVPATVSEVVDVTGAGDIFMASFVYAWSLQLPAEDCLRFANELAGESCRHLGTYVVPREFAQSVLDRLRASKQSDAQGLSNSDRSNALKRSRWLREDGEDLIAEQSDAYKSGIPHVDFAQAAKVLSGLSYSPIDAQTLPQSPLGPIESSASLAQWGHNIQHGPDSSQQTGQNTQNSIESERHNEHKSKQDRVLHPGKS